MPRCERQEGRERCERGRAADDLRGAHSQSCYDKEISEVWPFLQYIHKITSTCPYAIPGTSTQVAISGMERTSSHLPERVVLERGSSFWVMALHSRGPASLATGQKWHHFVGVVRVDWIARRGRRPAWSRTRDGQERISPYPWSGVQSCWRRHVIRGVSREACPPPWCLW